MGTKLPTLEMKAQLLGAIQQTVILLNNGLFPGESGPIVQRCIKVQMTIFESLLEEWLKVPEAKEHKHFEDFKKCHDEIIALKADVKKKEEESKAPPVEEEKVLNRIEVATQNAEEKLRIRREKKQAKGINSQDPRPQERRH